MNQFLGGNKTQAQGGASTGPTGQIPAYIDRPARNEVQNWNAIPSGIAPMWPSNSSLDISIYVSSSIRMPALSAVPQESLVMEEKAFNMANWSESREVDTTFKVPKEVQQNGTLWAHFYVALSGHQLDPAAKDYSPESAVHFLRPLNQYLPKKKVAKRKNLLASSEDAADEEEDNTPKYSISSYYHPNFTVSVIPDFGVANYQQMHPAVRQYVHLESTGARDITGQNTWYYPVLYLNTFWQLRSHMTELNSTVETLPLRIVLNNLSNWKFNILASMDEGAKQNARNAASGQPVPGGGDGSEFEMIKEVLLDTNIYLLGTTAIVSVLHMIFETLAFKNDIVSAPLLSVVIYGLTSYRLIGARRKTISVPRFVLSLLTSSCNWSFSSTSSITTKTHPGWFLQAKDLVLFLKPGKLQRPWTFASVLLHRTRSGLSCLMLSLLKTSINSAKRRRRPRNTTRLPLNTSTLWPCHCWVHTLSTA